MGLFPTCANIPVSLHINIPLVSEANSIYRSVIMDPIKETPYVCHVFVCTNDRGGTRKSCADGESPLVRAALKKEINDRGWKGKVRVSNSGCMGLCGQGPNVVIYPQKVWFPNVAPNDVGQIVTKVEELLAAQS